MKKTITILLVSMMTTSAFTLCMGQSSIPQDTKKKSATTQQKQSQDNQHTEKAGKVVYTCSMHPKVVSDQPGKCPECKMNLVKKEVSAVNYTCPMHSEVTSDQPGKCTKCGMNLIKKTIKKNDSPKKM